MDNVSLFIEETKLDVSARKHLSINGDGGDGVDLIIHEYSDIKSSVKQLVENDRKIWISKTSSVALTSIVPEANLITENSPITYLKALKNSTEIEGMRQAHIRDAVALTEFFCWLEQEVPKDELTEITASDKLEELRRDQDDFVSLSFPTISGVGSNGAIIHYRSSKETDRMISRNALYLCDSGAQYKDGTTDVTRTVHFGTPTRYEQECFTRVFKGHVALASAVFPNKTTGHRMDILSRKALWDVGLDFQHGTGHGVGAFLNVHEGPQRISFRAREDEVPFEEGMNITIEPGYYEEGKFGIRIENVYNVKKVELEHNFLGK
ncbi:Xaa-Pro aminopeptidase 1, partial [Exaiptasia diaphana]